MTFYWLRHNFDNYLAEDLINALRRLLMYPFFSPRTQQTQTPNPFTLALFSMLFNCVQAFDNNTNSDNNGARTFVGTALVLFFLIACFSWCCCQKGGCGNKEESKEPDGDPMPATQNTPLMNP